MDPENDTPAEEASKPSRRLIVLVSAGVIAAAALAVAAYLAWPAPPRSPERAITDLASAAMRGDADSVAASLDTSTLVDAAVDEVFSEGDEKRAIVSEYLRTHPDMTEDQVKHRARSLLDEEIREHVEAGTLPKRIPLGNKSLKEMAAKALAKRTVRSVRVEGDRAYVTVSVPYKGKSLTVKVRMKRSGDSWKVDKIENLADVMDQAGY